MASEDEVKLVIARLKCWPSSVKLSIGKFGQLSRDELIEHVKHASEGDEIGEQIIKMQLHFLQSIKKE